MNVIYNKKIIKILIVFIIMIAGHILFASEHHAKEIIRVGMYENPPKIFTNSEGKPDGFFPKLIEAIAEENNWEIKYIHGSFADGLKRLEDNKIDIMPDVAYSDERCKKYYFNEETVISDWGRLYSRKGIEINTLLDLNNKNIAVMRNGIYNIGPNGIRNKIKMFELKSNVIEAKDYKEAFEKISSGEADAGAVNRLFGSKNYKKYGLVETPILISPISIRFALSKKNPNSPNLIKTIDTQLKKYRADSNSIYHKALEKYIGQKSNGDIVEIIPYWLKRILLIFVILFLLLLGTSILLRKQVQARTSELVKANEELRTLDQLKTNLLSNVSHELRTPLVALLSYTELMLDEKAGPITDKQNKYLKVCLKSIGRLTDLIDNLLEFSRLELGVVNLNRNVFDIRETVNETISMIEPKSAFRNIEIIKYLPEESLDINGDRSKIIRVISNLLDNAVKFSSDKSNIIVKLKKINNTLVELSIKDYGIGIPEKDLDKIFDRFYQVDSTVTRNYNGVGIGLAITKDIVKMHKGDIKVYSKKGEGTTFVITLPLK